MNSCHFSFVGAGKNFLFLIHAACTQEGGSWCVSATADTYRDWRLDAIRVSPRGPRRYIDILNTPLVLTNPALHGGLWTLYGHAVPSNGAFRQDDTRRHKVARNAADVSLVKKWSQPLPSLVSRRSQHSCVGEGIRISADLDIYLFIPTPAPNHTNTLDIRGFSNPEKQAERLK